MTKKWKYNKIQIKEGFRGDIIIHQDSGAIVGKVYPGASEIVSDIVVSMVENSEEVGEFLEDL